MKHLIKLFWKLTTTRFLLQELHDHRTLVKEYLLSDRDRDHINYLLSEYIEPELERRGL